MTAPILPRKHTAEAEARRVLRAERAAARRADGTLELAARGDISAELEEHSMKVWRWSSHPSFPKPLAILLTGPIYDLLEVQAWYAEEVTK